MIKELEGSKAEVELALRKDRDRREELDREIDRLTQRRELERKENKKLNQEIMAHKLRERELKLKQKETLARITQLEHETESAAT